MRWSNEDDRCKTRSSLSPKRSPKAHVAIEHLFDGALQTVAQSSADEAERIGAARLLRLDARDQVVPPLLGLLAEETPPALQVAVIGALRSRSQPEIAERLARAVPAATSLGAAGVARRNDFNAAGGGAGVRQRRTNVSRSPTSTSPVVRSYYSMRSRRSARRRSECSPPSRRTARKSSSDIRRRSNSPATSLAASRCSPRRVRVAIASATEGKAIGPDIGDSALKSSAQLLTDVLDPNRAIDANFVSYTALTQAGLAHQGIITAETDGGIVLLTADGATITILRSELESLTGGKSLMPEGLGAADYRRANGRPLGVSENLATRRRS